MADFKTINIFLASSNELKNERTKFGDFISSLNTIFENVHIRIILRRWEDFNAAYHLTRKQAEYNQSIRNSQIFLALFYTKAGKYTIEEFDVAIKEYKKNGISPQSYVYMKELKKGKEETSELSKFKKRLDKGGCFWINYTTTDKLHLNFLMQFISLINDPEFKFYIDNDEIKAGNLSVAKLANLSFAANNENYKQLKVQKDTVEKEIKGLESAFAVTQDEEIGKKLGVKRSESYQIEERIGEFGKRVIDIERTIISTQGEELSERYQKASKLFQKGDINGANAELDIDKINLDVKKDMETYKTGKKMLSKGHVDIKNRIEEYRLKAKIIIARYGKDNNAKEVDEAYSKAVELARGIKIPNADYLNLIWEYGSFLDDYAFYEKALQIRKECVQLSIEINGEEDQSTANCYNNLGVIYRKKGVYDKALENHEKALEIKKKVFGENHPDTATSYNNIGNVYYSISEYAKALENYEKALEIKRKVFGENHSSAAMSYNNLGIVYENMDEYAKALENYETALEIKRKVFGENHPNTASSYNNLGNVYADMGEYAKALKNYEKSLEIYRNIFGDNHPNTAMSYNNFGELFEARGEYSKALDYHEKALTIRKKFFDKNHPDIAESYKNLGIVYADKKNYTKAFEYYYKSVSIYKKVLGEKHPDTLKVYYNMGKSFAAQAEKEKAQEYMKKAATGGNKKAIKWLQNN